MNKPSLSVHTVPWLLLPILLLPGLSGCFNKTLTYPSSTPTTPTADWTTDGGGADGGATTEGPQTGAVRTGAVRTGAVRTGAVRTGAVRTAAVRMGAVRIPPPPTEAAWTPGPAQAEAAETPARPVGEARREEAAAAAPTRVAARPPGAEARAGSHRRIRPGGMSGLGGEKLGVGGPRGVGPSVYACVQVIVGACGPVGGRRGRQLGDERAHLLHLGVPRFVRRLLHQRSQAGAKVGHDVFEVHPDRCGQVGLKDRPVCGAQLG